MMLKLLRLLGGGLRNGLVAIGALAFIGTIGAVADYALTQGAGTNFASKVITAVHYAAGLICDATAGETQCAAVDVHGQQLIDVNTANNNLYAAITGPIAAGSNLIGGTTKYLGTTATVNEPCQTAAKVTTPISQAASGVIIAHSGTLKTYICGGTFNISDAESVSIVEGTGVTCGTSTVALMGSTTVANGMALSANEGMSLGNGNSSNIVSKTGGDDICILQSLTGRLAGWVTYVQQ